MIENSIQTPPGSWFARFRKTVWTWILIVFRLNIVALWQECFVRPKKIVDFPNKSGEVAVITGGARGIGFETVKRLLMCNYDVIMGVRNTKVGEEAIEKLRTEGISTGSVKVLQLDLKSLNSVRDFAKQILKESSRVDLLLNNAGIMFAPYEVTEDGYESTFQVNYLSHFLLTQLLLPKITETGQLRSTCCRIINVSSGLHYVGNIDFDNLEQCKVYSRYKSYADSKLCQVMQTKYMNTKLEEENAKVRMYAVHPGMIPSNLWTNMSPWFIKLLSVFHCFLKKLEDGGDAVLFTAVAEELENSGGAYINNSKVYKPFHEVNNHALQEQLHQRSIDLLQQQV